LFLLLKRIACTVALLALLGAGYYFLAPARTPATQLALTSLDRRGFTAFEQLFDDAADRVRVVALFSPT
jgi:hypothetical protein